MARLHDEARADLGTRLHDAVRPDHAEGRVRLLASDHLDDLRFQRKTTRGLKAKWDVAKLGVGLEESSSDR